MTAQPGRRSEGPLADTTVGAIRAILALYDQRHLTLQTAIDEIAALVDVDRAHRANSGRARRPPTTPGTGTPPAGRRRRLRTTD